MRIIFLLDWCATGNPNTKARQELMALFAIQQRRKKGTDQPPLRYVVEPCFVLPADNLEDATTTHLGPLDSFFAQQNRRTTFVELLLLFTAPLDPPTLIEALRSTLSLFPSACGCRSDTVIQGIQGVRFSAIMTSSKDFKTRPPSKNLFDVPTAESGEVLTLRLATTDDGAGMSAIGIVFDHALSDVSGPALLLSHLSYHYSRLLRCAATRRKSADTNFTSDDSTSTEDIPLPLAPLSLAPLPVPPAPSPPPPSPHNDRSTQSRIQTQAHSLTSALEEGGGTTPRCERLKGGVACVEFIYSEEKLQEIQSKYKASTRHEAAFVDLVMMLRAVSNTPISTATISRDDRSRANISSEHFGNGIVLVVSEFKSRAVVGEGSGGGGGGHGNGEGGGESGGDGGVVGVVGDDGDDSDDSDDSGGERIVESLRSAIKHGVGILNHGAGWYADVHLNTWWHPLQRKMKFGGDDTPIFVIGPSSLAAAGQMCVARGGQPNVTILPGRIESRQGEDSGCHERSKSSLSVSLVAPLQMAHQILSTLKKRKKEENKRRKKLKKALLRNKDNTTLSHKTESKVTCPMLSNKSVAITLPPPCSNGIILFLHGLGDISCRWHKRFQPYVQVKEKNFLQPQAPIQNVTAQPEHSPLASWFDIQSMPVSISEISTPSKKSAAETYSLLPAGMSDSIRVVHETLDKIRTTHPTCPVVLGGFSQGGALAVQAALSYPHELAGVVSISGWLPSCPSSSSSASSSSASSSSSSSSSSSRVSSLPLATQFFFSYGTADPVVNHALCRSSCDALIQIVGNDSVTRNVVQRGKHSPKGKEVEAAGIFIKQCFEEDK